MQWVHPAYPSSATSLMGNTEHIRHRHRNRHRHCCRHRHAQCHLHEACEPVQRLLERSQGPCPRLYPFLFIFSVQVDQVLPCALAPPCRRTTHTLHTHDTCHCISCRSYHLGAASAHRPAQSPRSGREASVSQSSLDAGVVHPENPRELLET